jgi:hypothetical protein
MDSVVLLFYTHSEYVDIAIPSLFRIKKFWPQIQIALCTNDASSILDKYPTEFNFKYIYEFKQGELFYDRLVGSLNLIKEPYVVFHTDIHIFVSQVDNEFFLRLLERVQEEHIDCVRLQQCGTSPSIITDNIYEIQHNIYGDKTYFFGAIPALWKKESLLLLASTFAPYKLSWVNTDIHEIQVFTKNNFKNYIVYTPEDEQMLGPGCMLCKFFPFIHITGGGRWRMWKPQIKFIEEFWKEFNINPNSREQLIDACGADYYCTCEGH